MTDQDFFVLSLPLSPALPYCRHARPLGESSLSLVSVSSNGHFDCRLYSTAHSLAQGQTQCAAGWGFTFGSWSLTAKEPHNYSSIQKKNGCPVKKQTNKQAKNWFHSAAVAWNISTRIYWCRRCQKFQHKFCHGSVKETSTYGKTVNNLAQEVSTFVTVSILTFILLICSCWFFKFCVAYG